MKKLLLLFLVCLSTLSFGQEIEDNAEAVDSLYPVQKRIALGIKIGIPNIAGFSVEAITPLFNNRVAPFFDFSSFPLKLEEIEIVTKYNEFGSNFYLGKEATGLYAGIGIGQLSTDLTFTNIDLTDRNGNRGTGTVKTNQKINTTNVKLGIKTEGTIYFRLELGYGFGNIPTAIEIKGSFDYTDQNGNTRSGTGTGTEDFPPIPGVGTNGVLIGNFGFGVSF